MTFRQRVKQWYIFTWARRLPTCKEITKSLSESMEHKLPLGKRIIIRLHLHICDWCVKYKDQIHLLRKLLHEMPEDGPDSTVSLSEEARDRIKRSLAGK